jgi:F-type H+-transporting ATPase subunit gamma
VQRLQFFKQRLAATSWRQSQLGDAPSINDLIGTVKVMLDAFDEGEIDRLYWCPTSSSTP